jgi:TolB-like protein/Tfp pilus assembly protein PilF
MTSPSNGDLPLQLTPRQLEVFHLMAKGLSNRDICELLGISNNTVKIHVAAILRNLNAANRTEAAFAYKEMLTDDNRDRDRLRVADRIGRPAIAVLPFQDLASTEGESVVAAGVVEELIDRLSAWQWFPVISSASSRRYSGTDLSAVDIGRQLKAGYLLLGSLRHSEKRIRVTAQLVETDQGQVVWSQVYELSMDELFNLQTEIARHIVHSVAPELITAEAQIARHEAPSAFDAWQSVCQGTWLLNRGTLQDVEEAMILFDQAINADPNFSLAWNGRVCARQKQIYEQWVADQKQAVAALFDDAQTCFRLQPGVAHSHASMGLAHILVGQREPAIDHLERAVELNPSSTRALVLLAQAYGMCGRLDDCIMYLEDLLRIDPLSPSATRYQTVLGMCHYMSNRYQEGIRWSRSAIASDHRATGAYLSVIGAHVEMGDMDGATEALAELRASVPEFELSRRIDMMRPFTEPVLLERLVDALAKAGLTQ